MTDGYTSLVKTSSVLMIMLAGARCDVETRVEYVDAALYNEGLNLDRMDGMKEKVTIVRPKKSV